MNREEIIRVVNEFLTEELEIDAALLKDEALLKEDLKIDSLDFVDTRPRLRSKISAMPCSWSVFLTMAHLTITVNL